MTVTPAQTKGPYYPNRLPLDQDNDLLIVNDAITPAVGAVAWMSGRVLSRSGSPVRAALATLHAVRLQIHNQQAAVAYSGLVSPGLYQFNITVPDLPDGDCPVTAEVDGVRTDKSVKLRIERQATAAL